MTLWRQDAIIFKRPLTSYYAQFVYTEIIEYMGLKPVTQKFILHWGKMGTCWGVNRTVSQIHALLYLAGRPLPAEDIAETLGVARSNVSTSLRELQNWRLVKVVHVMGE
jgi:DNA-binding transcriptional regulator GbsR (MarR family)